MTAPVHEGWSMPIGIVMIVLGALAGLASVGRVATPIIMSALPDIGGDAYMVARVVGGVLLTIAALVGLIAGIGLVSKKPWALRLALVWAAAKLIILIPAVVVDGLVQLQMVEASSQTASPMPAGYAIGFGVMTAVMTFLFAGALPVFILAFCGRPRAREAWNARFVEATA